MTISKTLAGLAMAGITMSAGTAAWAGEPVYGYGSSRASAATDANYKAERMSNSKFNRGDCYTPVRPQDCKQSDGGWTCIAYLANHRGSCGF